MNPAKTFFIHLGIGLVYILWILIGTWNVSGGDIARWMALITLLFIHLLVLLILKNRTKAVKAWFLLVLLAILGSSISDMIYRKKQERLMREGVVIPKRLE